MVWSEQCRPPAAAHTECHKYVDSVCNDRVEHVKADVVIVTLDAKVVEKPEHWRPNCAALSAAALQECVAEQG